MHAFLKAVALAAAVALFFVSGETIAIAQAASSAAASAPNTSVSISVATYINPILETLGALIGTAAAGSIVALLVAFVPAWLRPLATQAVQATIAHYIVDGIGYAIQEIEGFDKDKTIDVNVGNAGVASALRYVLAQAPTFLINLAGGKDAIVAKIIAFLHQFGITLDAATAPAQVASTAAKSA